MAPVFVLLKFKKPQIYFPTKVPSHTSSNKPACRQAGAGLKLNRKPWFS
jgi:hypothetical protein